MVERGEHVERGVEPIGGDPAIGRDDGVAAADLVVPDAVQVERHSMARTDPFDRGTEGLDRADPRLVGSGLDEHRVIVHELAPGEGACHHRPGPFRREHPVDPQTRPSSVGRRRRLRDQPVERRAELVEAATAQ